MKKLILPFIFLLTLVQVSAQHVVNQILYGSAYYHEYMPFHRVDDDLKMMKEAGLNVIRIGESTWSLWEPEDGKFEFAWIDEVLDKAQEYGIKVIVGTPTYAIPPWMAERHPDIMVTTFTGQAKYGGRQNMDITNPKYLFYAERMIRAMMEHIKDHPAIIGYQIDNETKSYKTASSYANQLFIDHLKNKFVTLDSLNKTWNLAYWSQSLTSWNDFQVTGSWANQAIRLEWDRFQHQLITNFLQWQRDILEDYIHPEQFITQNFDLYWRNDESTGPNPDVDHFQSAQTVDIAGIDVYHKWGNYFDGQTIAFAGDYTRSFKKDNYLVIETQAQAKGWNNIDQYAWFDGQIRQAVYSHLASGANMVSYWPWHSIHNGGETYWKGVLSHDLQPNRAYREVGRTAHELEDIGSHLVNLEIKNRVAILYSIESFNALFIKTFSRNYNYADLVNQLYGSLYRKSISADFVTPDSDFSGYDLLLVPPLYIASDEQLNRIKEYVANGGHVVMIFKSGFCDENSTIRPQMAPGPLKDVCGFHYQEFYNSPMVSLKSGNEWLGNENRSAGEFVELLIPDKAEVLATYEDPFYKSYPAITRNEFGKGWLMYEGSVLSDKAQDDVISLALKETNIPESVNESFNFPLVKKSGVNQLARTIDYIFNYSSEKSEITWNGPEGINLLTEKHVKPGEKLEVEPWGVIIIESKSKK